MYLSYSNRVVSIKDFHKITFFYTNKTRIVIAVTYKDGKYEEHSILVPDIKFSFKLEDEMHHCVDVLHDVFKRELADREEELVVFDVDEHYEDLIRCIEEDKKENEKENEMENKNV